VQPMLAEIDSPEDLQAALADVGSFLDKAKDGSGALGAKMFLLSKKSLIQAMLPWPLKWEDMLPALYEVTELSDARELAADPEGFLARFTRPQEASKEQMKKKPCYEFGEPWACKILLLQAQDELQPKFIKAGVTWEEGLHVFSALRTVKEINAAISGPDKTLKSLKKGNSLATRRLLIIKARPTIEPKLPGELTWDDVIPALEGVREASELRSLTDDPSPLIARLTCGPSVLAQNAATGGTRLVLRPDMMQRSQRRLYDVFFDKKSPSNLVNVFNNLATNLIGMFTNSAVLVARMCELVMKCLPPAFPIVVDIALDIAKSNAKAAFKQLDFDLKKVPFILARNLRRIIQFPHDARRFFASVKHLVKLISACLRSRPMPLLQRIEGKEDDIVDTELDASSEKVQLGDDMEALEQQVGDITAEVDAAPDEAAAVFKGEAADDIADEKDALGDEEDNVSGRSQASSVGSARSTACSMESMESMESMVDDGEEEEEDEADKAERAAAERRESRKLTNPLRTVSLKLAAGGSTRRSARMRASGASPWASTNLAPRYSDRKEQQGDNVQLIMNDL